MERAKEAAKKSTYLEVLGRASKYLEGFWTKMDVGISLMYFEETHGREKIDAMLRFMNWAETNGQTSIVAATLGHDLKGCQDAMMSPRTSGY